MRFKSTTLLVYRTVMQALFWAAQLLNCAIVQSSVHFIVQTLAAAACAWNITTAEMAPHACVRACIRADHAYFDKSNVA